MKSLKSLGGAVGSLFSKGYQKMKGAFIVNQEYGEEEYLEKDEDLDLNEFDDDCQDDNNDQGLLVSFDKFYEGYLTANREEIQNHVQK